MCWEFSWGQQKFSWPFSPVTETLFQSESFPPGPTLPEETEAKVRTFTGGRGGSVEGQELLTPCLYQGVLESDGLGMESPGPRDTVAQGDLEETLVVADLGPDTPDLKDQSPPQSLPLSPKAGEIPPRLPLTLSF